MTEKHKQIEELYKIALSLTNEYVIVDLFEIDKDLATKIEKQTGLNFEGYLVSIDNYSIKHTLEKHGNPIKEAKRGQINITKDDFLILPEIITDFDKVIFDIKSNPIKNTKKESLIFEKKN